MTRGDRTLTTGEAEDLRAKLALAAEQVRYLHNVINAVADPIFVKDEEHRWVTLNDAFCRFMGHPRETLLGKSDFDFFPEKEARVFWAKDEHVFLTGEENVNEEEFTDADKVTHLIATKKTLHVGSDGRKYIVGVIRDETAQKDAERQVLRLNADLADKVASLDAANRELESFSYSVSHDLRAPLRAIDGFSAALLEDNGNQLDDRGKEYLGRVRAGAHRMANLIDDFLHLSRVTRLELKYEQVDLTALALGISAQLRSSQPAREVQIDVTPGLSARGDARLLGVVLENLLGNAWKFTGTHPRAHIRVGAVKQGPETVFHVADDGAGFDMRYAERLFQPLVRLHSTAEFEGHGIGLATVQRIIHRHGGRLWAAGEVEKGATFLFTLGT